MWWEGNYPHSTQDPVTGLLGIRNQQLKRMKQNQTHVGGAMININCENNHLVIETVCFGWVSFTTNPIEYQSKGFIEILISLNIL